MLHYGLFANFHGLLLNKYIFPWYDTASLSAQKDFLGGGVVKNNPIFVKQILLHHIYANIWEFIWTKCVTHLLVFLI